MALKHENMLNQKIKFFTFVQILGEGAFAKVYGAIDQRNNSRVAIKAIPKQLIKETPKLEQLVKTQTQVLKTCKNENVIGFVDSFSSVKTIFIVMEFCNGGDLQRYFQLKRRLTEDEATNFLKQILNGFKGLHEVGAMHRDFKLANVLLHNGMCKIADLGFAKQMQYKSMTTTVLGTGLTMAPQVLDAKPYGMEADLWSIGVVYYQMIYGKSPYTGRNDFEILKMIKNTRPDYSSVQISGQCRDFIDRCLTADPKKRIKWSEIYSHALLTKADGRFIYGLKSGISIGGNRIYYQERKNEICYPDIGQKMKNNFQDVEFKDGGQIRESMNVNQLLLEINKKKQRDFNFNKYEKMYLNTRNNIMFIFKFICPYVNTLVKYKANHGISLFIMSKKAFIDMKQFINNIKSFNNIFNLKNDWHEFTKSQVYENLTKQVQEDAQTIAAQAISYQYDIQIQSKQIKAEQNIHIISSKNWTGLVSETINEYWYLLAQNMDNSSQYDKETLIRVLQALDYYRQNKVADIEDFQRNMEVLNIKKAQERIKAKIYSIYQ